MNMSKRKLDIFLTLGAVLLIAALGFLVHQTFIGGEKYKEQNVAFESSCSSPHVEKISNIEELVGLGNYYFGHAGTYNIPCAKAAYEKAIDLAPEESALAYYQLGRINFLDGNFAAALENFDKRLSFEADDLASVYYMIGLTYGYRARDTGSKADWIEAERYFEQFLSLEPTSPWGATDLAWVLFSQGKFEEMKPVLEKALMHYPDHPWVHNMYGLAILNTSSKTEAREHFQRALDGSELLTLEQWGNAYPGNNPLYYYHGLSEMREIMRYNLGLAN